LIRFSESLRVKVMIKRSIVILIGLSSVAFAQNPDTSNVCWRPRPLAKCKSWIITDAAVETLGASTSAKHLIVGLTDGLGYVSDDFSTRLAFTVGRMVNLEGARRATEGKLNGPTESGRLVNRGPKSAVGISLSMVNTDLPGRIEGRYRRWVDPELGLDVSVGAMRGTVRGVYDPDEVPIRGATASVGLSGPYVGADVRFDLARSSARRTVGATYIAFRTSGKAAPITTVTCMALFLGLLYAAYDGHGS
jgi:hypothetical protein